MKPYKKLYHPIETGKRPLDTNWTGVDIYQKKQQALQLNLEMVNTKKDIILQVTCSGKVIQYVLWEQCSDH